MQLTNHLQQLKNDLLKKDANFPKLSHQFLDLMQQHAELIELAKKPKLQDKLLIKKLLIATVQRAFKTEVKITELKILALKKHRFFHGFVAPIQNRPIMFFYFADVHMGLITIGNFNGNTDYFRLTAVTSDKPIQASSVQRSENIH